MKQKEILLEKKIDDLKDKEEIILRELVHFEADMLQKIADLRERILS